MKSKTPYTYFDMRDILRREARHLPEEDIRTIIEIIKYLPWEDLKDLIRGLGIIYKGNKN